MDARSQRLGWMIALGTATLVTTVALATVQRSSASGRSPSSETAPSSKPTALRRPAVPWARSRSESESEPESESESESKPESEPESVDRSGSAGADTSGDDIVYPKPAPTPSTWVPPQLPEIPAEQELPTPNEAAKAYSLPALGPSEAPVEIVECGDYDCVFCMKLSSKLRELRDRYPDDVAVYWLHAPLPFHETALPAALGAQAAADQGKFWQFHAELLDEDARHDHEALLQIAETIGLDLERFDKALNAPETAEAVAKHRETCMQAGARGIPSLFINGDLVMGDQSIETLIETVERTLAEE